MLYPNTTIGKQTGQNDEGVDVEGDYALVDLAPGLTVTAYLSPRDGALVVQIDTPLEGEHEDQCGRARVYINDYQWPL